MNRSARPRILCVAPFNNPHILPIYDALAEFTTIEVHRATLRRTPRERLQMGWSELPEDSPYIQAWRTTREWTRYWRLLVGVDIAILPGVFHFRKLYFHHVVRSLAKKTAFWSEPFLQHPRTLAQSKLWGSLRRALLAPINSKSMCLLAAGSGAENDYRKLGMHRWECRLFSLAVEPNVSDGASAGDEALMARLVYCGALSERKGVDILIDAVCDPQMHSTDFHLTLIGDGPLRDELERKCATVSQLNGKITFVGNRPREEVQSELTAYDALILPSQFDGWGAVVNEAMEAGLAVVVSDGVGSRRPLVEPGHNGMVFERNSVPDLVQTLRMLIESPGKLDDMKRCSCERIARFRLSRIAEALHEWCLAKAQNKSFEPDNGLLQLLPEERSCGK